MGSPSTERPPPLPPGTPLGDHYTVEGLVRLAEGRMFYLVNNRRPDRLTLKCWECHSEETPRDASECVACGAPMKPRRFLVSSRWKPDRFDAYKAYFDLHLEHPGLCTPVDILRNEDELYSVTPYNGEGLMLDEASPFPNGRLVDLAQRIAGTIAFLHHNGVRLAGLSRANLIVLPDNQVLLYDLEVREVRAGPIPEEIRGEEIAMLGALLRSYCDVEEHALEGFMGALQEGRYDSPATFGRALEKQYQTFAATPSKGLVSGMTDVGLVR